MSSPPPSVPQKADRIPWWMPGESTALRIGVFAALCVAALLALLAASYTIWRWRRWMRWRQGRPVKDWGGSRTSHKTLDGTPGNSGGRSDACAAAANGHSSAARSTSSLVPGAAAAAGDQRETPVPGPVSSAASAQSRDDNPEHTPLISQRRAAAGGSTPAPRVVQLADRQLGGGGGGGSGTSASEAPDRGRGAPAPAGDAESPLATPASARDLDTARLLGSPAPHRAPSDGVGHDSAEAEARRGSRARASAELDSAREVGPRGCGSGGGGGSSGGGCGGGGEVPGCPPAPPAPAAPCPPAARQGGALQPPGGGDGGLRAVRALFESYHERDVELRLRQAVFGPLAAAAAAAAAVSSPSGVAADAAAPRGATLLAPPSNPTGSGGEAPSSAPRPAPPPPQEQAQDTLEAQASPAPAAATAAVVVPPGTGGEVGAAARAWPGYPAGWLPPVQAAGVTGQDTICARDLLVGRTRPRARPRPQLLALWPAQPQQPQSQPQMPPSSGPAALPAEGDGWHAEQQRTAPPLPPGPAPGAFGPEQRAGLRREDTEGQRDHSRGPQRQPPVHEGPAGTESAAAGLALRPLSATGSPPNGSRAAELGQGGDGNGSASGNLAAGGGSGEARELREVSFAFPPPRHTAAPDGAPADAAVAAAALPASPAAPNQAYMRLDQRAGGDPAVAAAPPPPPQPAAAAAAPQQQAAPAGRNAEPLRPGGSMVGSTSASAGAGPAPSQLGSGASPAQPHLAVPPPAGGAAVAPAGRVVYMTGSPGAPPLAVAAVLACLRPATGEAVEASPDCASPYMPLEPPPVAEHPYGYPHLQRPQPQPEQDRAVASQQPAPAAPPHALAQGPLPQPVQLQPRPLSPRQPSDSSSCSADLLLRLRQQQLHPQPQPYTHQHKQSAPGFGVRSAPHTAVQLGWHVTVGPQAGSAPAPVPQPYMPPVAGAPLPPQLAQLLPPSLERVRRHPEHAASGPASPTGRGRLDICGAGGVGVGNSGASLTSPRCHAPYNAAAAAAAAASEQVRVNASGGRSSADHASTAAGVAACLTDAAAAQPFRTECTWHAAAAATAAAAAAAHDGAASMASPPPPPPGAPRPGLGPEELQLQWQQWLHDPGVRAAPGWPEGWQHSGDVGEQLGATLLEQQLAAERRAQQQLQPPPQQQQQQPLVARSWPASGAAAPEGPLTSAVVERLMIVNPLFGAGGAGSGGGGGGMPGAAGDGALGGQA